MYGPLCVWMFARTPVLWASEETADAASADRGVTTAHVRLSALGLVIEARQIYEVVAHDEHDKEPARSPIANRSMPSLSSKA